MTTQKSRLAIRVELVNETHILANEIQPKLIELFRPYVGQTILLPPSNRRPVALLAEITKQVEDFKRSDRVYKDLHYCGCPHKLKWKIVSKSRNHYPHMYYECIIPIGDISDPSLMQLNEPSNFKTDYVYSDILAKTKKTEKLRQAYETAKRDLLPFNEFV